MHLARGMPSPLVQQGICGPVQSSPVQPALPVVDLDQHLRSGQPSTFEIWVVRHGETAENTTRTIAGQNGSKLTPLGHNQAELVAKRLQGVKFAAIYISDLARTKQTADPIIRKAIPGTLAFTDTRLREKAAGRLEGHPISQIEVCRRQSGLTFRHFRPPGGENWEDVAARSRSFMREMIERHVGSMRMEGGNRSQQERGTGQRRILVISHGGFISEFLSGAIGVHVANNARNCSVYVLGINRRHSHAFPEFHLRVANDTRHLAALEKAAVPRAAVAAATVDASSPVSSHKAVREEATTEINYCDEPGAKPPSMHRVFEQDESEARPARTAQHFRARDSRAR